MYLLPGSRRNAEAECRCAWSPYKNTRAQHPQAAPVPRSLPAIMATTMNTTTASVCPHNGTAHDGTLLCHWANGPGARGTLNIFWLCISTLGLCAWNAVHPDVPSPNAPGSQVFGMRVWWLFVGLFMPEMLVLVALAQLRQALKLLADVDNCGLATQFPWWMYLFVVCRDCPPRGPFFG